MAIDIRQPFVTPLNLKEQEWVKQARSEAKRLRVHMIGTQEDTSKYLNKIEMYETADQYFARRKHCTPNKAVFSELLAPVDKIFTARGGSRVIDVGSDKVKLDLENYIKEIEGGRSVQRWLKDVWKLQYFIDAAGVILMESDGKFSYPTFKSIDHIRNYQRDGRQIDWIVFEPVHDGDKKIARAVGNGWDAQWDVSNPDEPKIIEGTVIELTYKVTPALINGTKEAGDLTRMISDLDEVMDIADHYLRTTSVKNIHEFQHGIPVYWEYGAPCNVCNGTGLVQNGATCHACNGDGFKQRKDISEKIRLKTPKNTEQPTIAPDVAGFVEPSHETWEQYRTEQKNLIQKLHDTFWGTHTKEKADNETATGRFIDQQPVHDKLSTIAMTFEETDKWIVDQVGHFHFRDTYKGASIHYGRRFLIETPSAIWDDYQKAIKDGAPEAVKDYKLMQYWQSELRDDPLQMAAAMKLIQVEPFVHMSPSEVITLDAIPLIDRLAKVYFSDWSDQITAEQAAIQTAEQLRASLATYVQTKIAAGQGGQV
jgi:hypothetical protein